MLGTDIDYQTLVLGDTTLLILLEVFPLYSTLAVTDFSVPSFADMSQLANINGS